MTLQSLSLIKNNVMNLLNQPNIDTLQFGQFPYELLFIISIFLLFFSVSLILRIIRLRKNIKSPDFVTSKYLIDEINYPAFIFDDKFKIIAENNKFIHYNLKNIINLNSISNQIFKQNSDSFSLSYPLNDNKSSLLQISKINNNNLFLCIIKVSNDSPNHNNSDEFKMLIQNSFDGISIFNQDGKLLSWNKGAEIITGYKFSNIKDYKYWELIDKLTINSEKFDGLLSYNEILFKQSIETENTPELNKLIDKKIQSSDNKEIYIQERNFIAKNNDSKLLCCIFRDISDKKKLEETLFNSEKRFRQIIDKLPFTVFECDVNGDFTYLNSMGFELLDISFKEYNKGINGFHFLKKSNIHEIKSLFRKSMIQDEFQPKQISIINSKKNTIDCLIFAAMTTKKPLTFIGVVIKTNDYNIYQKNNIFYQELFNSLSTYVTLTNLKSQEIVEANDTMANDLEINKNEIIGKTTYELNLYSNLNKRTEFWKKIIKNGSANDYRIDIAKDDGTKLNLSSDAKVIEIQNKKYLLTETKHITNLIKYIQPLEKSEDKYRSLFELSPDIIAILNPDGIVLDINNKIEEFTGHSAKYLIGTNIFETDIINTKDKKLIQTNFKARILGKKLNPYTVTIKNINGTKKYCNVIGSTLKNPKGQVDKLFIIVSDITEQVKAKEVIKSRQIMLENITKTTPMSIFILDVKSWKILWHNETIFETFGYSKETIKNLDLEFFKNIIHKKDIYKISRFFTDNYDFSKGLVTEIQMLDNDNNWRWIYLKLVKYIASANKNTEQLLGIALDITYHKKNEEKLKELNATKDKFFSIISHDIKNPISSFLGLSELLYTNKNLRKEEIQAYSKSINDSAKKLYQLLDNLLHWSKLNTKQMNVNLTDFKLNDIFIEAMALYEIQAQKKEIHFLTYLDKNITVYCDRYMIYTIVRNLISNAVKFSHIGGKVIIKSELFQDFVEISIKDFGTGMSNKIQKNLFKIDKIQSIKGTASETGSGLGLLIIKEFLDLHNCKLEIFSELNKGTTVKFKLPLFKQLL